MRCALGAGEGPRTRVPSSRNLKAAFTGILQSAGQKKRRKSRGRASVPRSAAATSPWPACGQRGDACGSGTGEGASALLRLLPIHPSPRHQLHERHVRHVHRGFYVHLLARFVLLLLRVLRYLPPGKRRMQLGELGQQMPHHFCRRTLLNPFTMTLFWLRITLRTCPVRPFSLPVSCITCGGQSRQSSFDPNASCFVSSHHVPP